MKKQKKACGVTGETELCKTQHIWPLEKGINLNLIPHYLIDSKMIDIFYSIWYKMSPGVNIPVLKLT